MLVWKKHVFIILLLVKSGNESKVNKFNKNKSFPHHLLSEHPITRFNIPCQLHLLIFTLGFPNNENPLAKVRGNARHIPRTASRFLFIGRKGQLKQPLAKASSMLAENLDIWVYGAHWTEIQANENLHGWVGSRTWPAVLVRSELEVQSTSAMH